MIARLEKQAPSPGLVPLSLVTHGVDETTMSVDVGLPAEAAEGVLRNELNKSNLQKTRQPKLQGAERLDRCQPVFPLHLGAQLIMWNASPYFRSFLRFFRFLSFFAFGARF